jgi:hypothetical protein
MPALTGGFTLERPQKITFADMRDMGVRGAADLLLGLQVRSPSPDHSERRSLACTLVGLSRLADHYEGCLPAPRD